MKPKSLLLAVAMAATLAIGVGLLWIGTRPRSPEQALEKAETREVRLLEQIDATEDGPAGNAADEAIAELETRIDGLWLDLIEDWPESSEAIEARRRLLAHALRREGDPAARVELIDGFLTEIPEHADRPDLLWQKAEIQRDELADPLAAVETFRLIEAEYPEDEIAPRAALALARIYESIHEFDAAEGEYARLAQAYPTSPEATEAEMHRAALLEDKLDRKREAAQVYQKVAKANPGSATGQMAERRRDKLLGEIKQSEQDKYYSDTYGLAEQNPFDITREELNSPSMRRLRAQGLDAIHYRVHVRMEPETARIDVDAVLAAELVRDLDKPLLLALNPALDIQNIALDHAERDVSFERGGPFVEIILPDELSTAGSQFDLHFRYGGTVGLWRGDSLTTAGASLRTDVKWYPQTVFGDFFTQQVTLDCPEPYSGIAQGIAIKKLEEAFAAEDLREGWHRAAWRQATPSQWMTVALGRYESLRFEGPGGVPMEVHLAADHEGDAEAYADVMRSAVEEYEPIFGTFPYERLAVVEVPDFPGGYGAPSLVLIGSIAFTRPGVPAKFLAHEIAHQWWGDLISIDLTEDSIPWLTEAFATYADAIYTERTDGPDAFLTQIRAMGNFYRENIVLLRDRPIAETLFTNPMYRSLMYEKGALVLHSLRREMGDDAFFALLGRFLEKHAGAAVTVSDFAALASEIHGRDLAWFFEQSLDRTGYARPKIEAATIESDGAGYRIALDLTQPDPPYRMTVDIDIETLGGSKYAREAVIDGPETRLILAVPSAPARLRIDPDSWHLLDSRPEMLEYDFASP